MEKMRQIPIWFFIGGLLTVYGVLIFAYGIVDWIRPTVRSVALSELHPNVWWGCLLLAIGLVYTVRYWPWRSNAVK